MSSGRAQAENDLEGVVVTEKEDGTPSVHIKAPFPYSAGKAGKINAELDRASKRRRAKVIENDPELVDPPFFADVPAEKRLVVDHRHMIARSDGLFKTAPTKLTPATFAIIIDAIRRGNYIETAAALAGVEKKYLYKWIKMGKREIDRRESGFEDPREDMQIYVDFALGVVQAEAWAEVNDLKRIDDAAEKGTWQAAAWRLERKHPEKFGNRVALLGKIEHEHTHHQGRVVKKIIENPDLIEKGEEFLRLAAADDMKNITPVDEETGE